MAEGLTTTPLPPQPTFGSFPYCSELAHCSSRGGAAAARRAHNPEVVGSSPTPATKCKHGFLVDLSEVVPPVPIPNTEVKRLSADDTAWATGCGK